MSNKRKLHSEGNRNLIEAAYGLAHVFAGFPFRHGHDTANGLFVAVGIQRDFHFGVAHAAVTLNDELNQNRAGNAVVTGNLGILDLLGKERVQSFHTTRVLRHFLCEIYRGCGFRLVLHYFHNIVELFYNIIFKHILPLVTTDKSGKPTLESYYRHEYYVVCEDGAYRFVFIVHMM